MTREELLKAAREAAQHAYAPYSHFRVGAALVVETPKGPKTVTGANIENASFGLTLCAERAALAAASLLDEPQSVDVAAEERGVRPRPRISQIAIACLDAPKDSPDYQRTPCGACRQWLAELAPSAVYYVDGIDRDLCLNDLLPMAFVLDEPHTAANGRARDGIAETSRAAASATAGHRSPRRATSPQSSTSQRRKRE